MEQGNVAQLLSDLANIGQIVEGFVAFILLVYAFFFSRELREAIRGRHLDGLQFVKELIGTPEAAKARRWAYNLAVPEGMKESPPHERGLSTEDYEKARSICRDFDTIGLLCRHALLPTKIVTETYNRNILQMWSLLSPIIAEWRQGQCDSDYFAEFEWLANKSRKAEASLAKKRRRRLKLSSIRRCIQKSSAGANSIALNRAGSHGSNDRTPRGGG